MTKTWRQSLPKSVVVLTLSVCVALISGCSTGAIERSSEYLQEGTPEEQQLLVCMQEKGWDVSIGRGGGVAAEFPSEQEDQYDAAQAGCGFDVADGEDVVLTDELLNDGYALQVDTLDCLRGEGYDGLSDPPTLQAYIDERGSWTAYGELPAMPEDEWIQIQETCPQPNVSLDDY
ncbi:hypothetical protein [Marisediminicola antarctica]|uniref:Uncharacterized protein n=1 Tax=Marisediminicola antarctica TaxID=674079 RepID=A0A7L5AIK8_9MICO|nr:hypothetical protein [Marisediminicola antarctica]QHO69625.1 hypothetical protein BHD05_08205 [Marisediminicola antarctica]